MSDRQLAFAEHPLSRTQGYVRNWRKKTAESHVKQAKELEGGAQGASVAIGKLSTGIMAYFAALLTVKKGEDLVAAITQTDASLGRIGASIGMSSQTLGA